MWWRRVKQSLNERLSALIPNYRVSTTSELGIDPKWVEGIAFAWLAMRYEKKLPANLPAVTGARCETILGGKYFAL